LLLLGRRLGGALAEVLFVLFVDLDDNF